MWAAMFSALTLLVGAVLLFLVSEGTGSIFRPRVSREARAASMKGEVSEGGPRAELIHFPKPQASGLKSTRRRVS